MTEDEEVAKILAMSDAEIDDLWDAREDSAAELKQSQQGQEG